MIAVSDTSNVDCLALIEQLTAIQEFSHKVLFLNKDAFQSLETEPDLFVNIGTNRDLEVGPS